MAGEAGGEVDEDRIPGRTAKILGVTGKLRQDLKSGNQAAAAADRLDLKRDPSGYSFGSKPNLLKY